MTIPAEVARQLGIGVGAELDVEVDNGNLVARPSKSARRKRYRLDELLEGCTPTAMRRIVSSTSWARDGTSVGREI